MKDLKKDKFNKLEEVLVEFLDNEIGIWFSVREKSLVNILKSKGFHKKMASTLLKNLLSANVIEKRGVTSATEYKILTKNRLLIQAFFLILEKNKSISYERS